MKTSVYITNEAVQVVQGHISGKKIVVDKYISESFIEDGCIINGVVTNESVLINQITSLWRKECLPKKDVYLIVDSGSVPNKILKLPNVPERQLLNVISDNFSDMGNAENRIFDYTILDKQNEDGGITVLACTAEEEFITGYIELFKKCGIGIGKMSLALGCQISYVDRVKELHDKTFIIALLDKNTIYCTLFVKGKYRFSNRNRIVAERNSEDMADEIERKISSIVQFNKSEKNDADITNIYFGGLNEEELYICTQVSQSVGISSEIMPNWAIIDIKVNKKKKNSDGIKLKSADFIYALGNIAAK